mmetsp:Transcript_53591/g.100451  ORF Transcript_53591/g.100451 Transcript_53591/m.100451 type:complete len:188 (+) Transcript_53591:39-602(+)
MRSRGSSSNGAEAQAGDEEAPAPASLSKIGALQPTCGLSWSAVALISIFLLLYLIVWTLPAPTLISKVALLRQSWHLSEVMKEPPVLQSQLDQAEKELISLRARVKEAKSKNDVVQVQVDSAEHSRKDLKMQLVKAQDEVVRLQAHRKDLSAKLEEEKTRRVDLAAKWKKLKESEMPLLKSIPDDDA